MRIAVVGWVVTIVSICSRVDYHLERGGMPIQNAVVFPALQLQVHMCILSEKVGPKTLPWGTPDITFHETLGHFPNNIRVTNPLHPGEVQFQLWSLLVRIRNFCRAKFNKEHRTGVTFQESILSTFMSAWHWRQQWRELDGQFLIVKKWMFLKHI